jgi:hypothetical protein
MIVKNEIFAVLIIISNVAAHAAYKQSVVQAVSQKTSLILRHAPSYLCSRVGVIDVMSGYTLGMGLTFVHELAHAVMGKILYGTPIKIELGNVQSHVRPLLKIGPVSLTGFNPAVGFYFLVPFGTQREDLKECCINLAGPLTGAAASAGVLFCLRKWCPQSCYAAKLAAGYVLFNQTIGGAGLFGMLIGTPNHDFTQALLAWKKYRASRNPQPISKEQLENAKKALQHYKDSHANDED